MEERYALMNMPTMSSRTYFKLQQNIHRCIEEVAVQQMKEGCIAEKEMAISRGEVDADGNALLTVVVDGSWAKRSYKCNYSSLSGVVS